jgi:Peptidase family C25/Ricin-type beta-trefoil lectin domain
MTGIAAYYCSPLMTRAPWRQTVAVVAMVLAFAITHGPAGAAAAGKVMVAGAFGTPGGLCLDTGKPDAQLGLAACNGSPGQAFTITDDGRMTGAEGTCVAAADTPAAPLTLAVCSSAGAQRWALRGQHLVGARNRCIVAAGAAVRLDACDRGNDIWTPLNVMTTLVTIGGHCLSANGSAAVVMLACGNTGAQHFRFTAKKEIVIDTGKCLDAGRSGAVEIAVCNGDGRQKWTLEGRAIKSASGLCLEVVDGRPTVGTPVRTATCAGTQGQQWFATSFYSEGIATLLVVTDAKMKAAADTLVAHKNRTGMPAAVANIDDLTEQFLNCRGNCPADADLAGAVKRGIDYFYRYRGTKYVFLAGDSTHVPVRYATHHDAPQDTPAKHSISYRATDLYYANLYHHRPHSDLAGGFSNWDANHDGAYNESRWLVSAYDFNPDDVDGYPDVAVGRIDVSQPGDLAKYVQKVIAYETVRMNAAGSSFFADEQYETADSLARSIANKLPGGERLNFFVIEHKTGHTLPVGWKSGGASDVQMAATNSNFIVYVGHGGPAQWGHDSAVVSRGTVGNMSQSNLPIVFGIGCETGAYTPDFRKFSLVPPETPPPPPQPFNAFSNWWLAHAGWDNGHSGGAIAYAGEPLVMPDKLGTELIATVFARYAAGERTLGDIWRAAQQAYWHAHLNTRKSSDNSWPFAEPRVYLGIMTLFGEPSLRLQRGGGPTR